jgi:segregation and condensation protein A
LTSDCTATVEVVARFLALLELFKEALVSFEQLTPLGDLLVRWTGAPDDDGTAAQAAVSDWPDESAQDDGSAAAPVDEAAPSD